MQQHTPTPWTLAELSDGRYCDIQDEDCDPDGHGYIASTLHTDIGEANAAHIVHCVNTHEQLVEALENALAYMESDSDDEVEQADYVAARAALAAAKKGGE